MKQWYVTVVVMAVASCVAAAELPPAMPMTADLSETTTYRWMNKHVLESRLLDDMEDPATWKLSGPGAMSFTRERSRDGGRSIRLTAPTKGDKPGGTMGRPFGAVQVTRVVPGEDWSAYDRLSFWVYPTLPGFNIVSLTIRLDNEGPERGRVINTALVNEGEWNHVVWEIPDLAREHVTGVALEYRLQGNEPGAAETVVFDFDQLELQKVGADAFEGWDVASGAISFSHTGYQTGAPKTAIAQDLDAATFSLVSQTTGQTAFTGPVTRGDYRFGVFQVLDFTGFDTPGTYIIRAGDVATRPFRIDDNVWIDTIWKVVNFFYVERCGCAIPGVHDVCHRDWMGVHDDKSMVINGGWHDAGDLSQGLVNTTEADYAMFSLAERLDAQRRDPELVARLIEEAKWGLDWIMKTSFHDGYRVSWATMDFWTNGILGDVDDVTSRAGNNPADNFYAAAAEAIAARVLKDRDPALAAQARAMAIEDWDFAVAGLGERGNERPMGVELAAIGAVASLDLFAITGDARHADRARAFGQDIMTCQETGFLAGLDVPITGFFYRDTGRDRILHYQHRGHEQEPIVALARLCETFPGDPDWVGWYTAVALHSEYFQSAMSGLTAPYDHLPNSLYHESEYLQFRGAQQDVAHTQILNGIAVGESLYVRTYPVQPSIDMRGNCGTVMSQTKAVTTAARLRRSTALSGLAQKQLQWMVGRNPFVQSLMWGEGYDFAPQYTSMSGDIVGSLPVGIKSLNDHDLPYWPATNVWNYKEVWVHPPSRWLWVMSDCAGPADVTGRIDASAGGNVVFRETMTGAVHEAAPDFGSGTFAAAIPQGTYTVTHGGVTRTVTLLAAASVTLDMRAGRAVDIALTHEAGRGGRVTITATVTGAGAHTLTLLSDTLAVRGADKAVTLAAGTSAPVSWDATIRDANAPWVAVVVVDGDYANRAEIIGH